VSVLIAFAVVTIAVAPAPSAKAGDDLPYDSAKAGLAAKISDPAQATDAYLAAVPEEQRKHTANYAHGVYAMEIVEAFFQWAVLLAMLGTGYSAWLRDWTGRVLGRVQVPAYALAFLVVMIIVFLPLTVLRSYIWESAFGLYHRDLAAWFKDQAKAEGIGIVVGTLAIWLLYAVLKRTPRTWWLWGWAVSMVMVILAQAVAPVYLVPVFYDVHRLPEGPQRSEILNLAKAHGVPSDDVYVIDASKNTNTISANVSGLLGTTRITLFDNLLNRCSSDEVLFVVGHEMGHYVLKHVWKGIAVAGVALFLTFALAGWIFQKIARRWTAAGITGIGDVAGLPLLFLLLVIFLSVLRPAFFAGSRFIENEADDFGLEATHLPDAAARAFLMLGEYRELDPPPVIEYLFFDHPAGRNRIRNAMEWKAAHAGKAVSATEDPGTKSAAQAPRRSR
jgi:Zn-dependent protease with chaperone function